MMQNTPLKKSETERKVVHALPRILEKTKTKTNPKNPN